MRTEFGLGLLQQAVHRLVDMGDAAKWGGGPQLHHDSRPVALVLFQPAQSMLEYRQVGSVILGQLRRAQERRVSAELARYGSDLLVIGGDDHPP